MTKYRDEDVIALLEGHGLSWRSFFLVSLGNIAFRDEHGKEMILIIEDDQMHSAACKFLKRQGLVQSQDGR